MRLHCRFGNTLQRLSTKGVPVSVPRYRRMRGLTAFMAAVGLLLAPAGISAASPSLRSVAPAAPKTVSLGVTTPCTGFFVGKPKKTNTVASVFADVGSASASDKNRLFYQAMAMVGDFSSGGVFVESKAIRVSTFFRDSRGRQHLRLLALGSMKVVGATVTFTVRGGQPRELMRTTMGTAIRKVKVSGKVFVVYDFVAPRRAHIDTVYLDAINPKPRKSGRDPVVNGRKSLTAVRLSNYV